MRAPQRIVVAAIAPQPWRNGAGRTRELALQAAPGGAPGAFDWRISIADVDRDAPFSAFPGVDRCIALLRGDGMRLVGAGIDHRLDTPSAAFRFPGETALDARLLGGPCADLNLMTRRGAWHGDIARLQCDVAHTFELPDADVTLLLAESGTWRIAGLECPAGVALLWRERRGHLALQAGSRGCALRAVTLCQHPAP